MGQRIHLAAIVARQGRVLLVRHQAAGEWELPGGPFLPEHTDPEAGMTEAALGVDAENLSGALHLYRKMGFEEVKRGMTFHKPL